MLPIGFQFSLCTGSSHDFVLEKDNPTEIYPWTLLNMLMKLWIAVMLIKTTQMEMTLVWMQLMWARISHNKYELYALWRSQTTGHAIPGTSNNWTCHTISKEAWGIECCTGKKLGIDTQIQTHDYTCRDKVATTFKCQTNVYLRLVI